MEKVSEFNRKELKNKSNNLSFHQISRSNFSKIKLKELIIPYAMVSDWFGLNIFFSDLGIIGTTDDFKKATDVIFDSLLYN